MVTRSLSINHLCQQELLQSLAVSKDTGMLQLWCEAGNSAAFGDGDLVQRLSMGSQDSLDNDVTMDEVGTDPRWIEDSVGVVKEHKADNVVANVTLFVHLCVWGVWEDESE